MPVNITISKTLSSNSASAPTDVLQIKKALNRLGFYIPHKDIGITDIPDASVFNALKEFQKKFGLPVTGSVKPDDATLTALNREISKPQKGYYIWRTIHDGHTRAAHAALDGTIRSWEDSPDVGEDFNCRCWAEPAPNAIEDVYTGWQKAAFDEIKDNEDIKNYPYLDSKGVITIGVGINSNNKTFFMELDFEIKGQNGKKASLDDKEKVYNYLTNFAKQEIANALREKRKPFNYKAEFYETKTNLILSDAEVNKRYKKHFKETLTKEVPNAFPKLSQLPDPAKIVIVDMMYNMGATRFSKDRWGNFFEAINNHDYKTAAHESHRKDVDKDRNDWAYKTLMNIKEK